MKTETHRGDAAHQYTIAQAAHHSTKDLRHALELYKGILAAHPDTQEARYSQVQILNIVNRVVPRGVLLDAQLELALTCLGEVTTAEAASTPGPSLASSPAS